MSKKLITLCTGLLLLVTLQCNAQLIIHNEPELFRWGDFGDTWIFAGGTQGVQLVLTDTIHQAQAINYAAQLSRQGNLSAVLNMENYLAAIKQRNAGCFDAATPLSVYAQDIQQHHQFQRFSQAFITGIGSAGSYVLAMLVQIPKGIFRGAYSIEWRDTITLPAPPCNNSSQALWNSQQQKLFLSPYSVPATPWKLFNTYPLIQQWLPGYPLLENWQADKKIFEISRDTPPINADKKAVSQLPLIEIPVTGSNNNHDLLAIIISGDGGWANIDKDIANQLSREGIAVIGWNALDYFWEEKSPDIAGRDLQAAIDYYTRTWNKNRLLLIGFSMGADVMPFMVNRLNDESRKKILSVNLLNPSTSVDFVFHVSGWLGNSGKAAHLLYPELKHWNQWPTLCFYSEQKDSLCEEIMENNAQKPDQQKLIYLPGDHHFDGNYQKLVQLILANITQ